MKPFKIFTNQISLIRWRDLYDLKSSARPDLHIEKWLNENIGVDRWEFRYDPYINPCGEISLSGEKLESGSTFFFDTEEDLLLFSLRWLSSKDNSIFWHPV